MRDNCKNMWEHSNIYEKRKKKKSVIFTLTAVLICCTGLLGGFTAGVQIWQEDKSC